MSAPTFKPQERFIAKCGSHRNRRGTVILSGHRHDGGLTIYYVVQLDSWIGPLYMAEDEMEHAP